MILILESHPVQYRAPVYRELQRRAPNKFLVVYASDCSVRGHRDRGFGVQVKWDEPLLEGYPFIILNNERGIPLSSRRSLHGRGLYDVLNKYRPDAVYFTGFAYEFEWVGLCWCRILGIPVWIRMETQDQAYARSPMKGVVRRLVYCLLYAGLDRAFYIGELNKRHLLAHGWRRDQLIHMPYCVVDRWVSLNRETAERRGREWRERTGLPADAYVVGFFGKLIHKKNPALLLAACEHLPPELKARTRVVLVGSGEEEAALKAQAEQMAVPVHFAGFVNQGNLADYYLGMDVMVLPSRRAGETWGLVVNEALLAGCGVAVSDAVGSHAEFGNWERVRVFPTEDASGCSRALVELAGYPRDFEWCRQAMADYSIERAAGVLAEAIK